MKTYVLGNYVILRAFNLATRPLAGRFNLKRQGYLGSSCAKVSKSQRANAGGVRADGAYLVGLLIRNQFWTNVSTDRTAHNQNS